MGKYEEENTENTTERLVSGSLERNNLFQTRTSRGRKNVPEDFAKYFQMLGKLAQINGAQKSNFMYSPASLYSALQAAVYAADGNTRQEIINLIGEKEYSLNSEAVNTWNFFVVNHKKDRKTEIRKEYAELLKTNQTLRAAAYELTEDNCDRLTEEINSRCMKETNGQITQAVSPKDFEDISPVDRFTALLGNVLHFRGK